MGRSDVGSHPPKPARDKEPPTVRFTPLLLTVVCMVAPVAEGRMLFAADAVLQPIQRVIPPHGVAIPTEARTRLQVAVAALEKRIERFRRSDAPNEMRRHVADVEVYLKGPAWALELDEFFAPADVDKAAGQLETGSRRLSQLESGRAPWRRATGQVVRGFVSSLDGSTQPYGLDIPEGLDLDHPCPLYVWLHGRGERTTEVDFIDRVERGPGRLVPENAIVLHPFGRYCNGFKSAGETDVMEAIQAITAEYAIDESRIVLAGFSMGGAGAWHLGAHYPSHWAAVQPGAGFAETALYQQLTTPDLYPPPHERKLWGLYDVPGYVRNLFNMPVLAYSGEIDKQIQAAKVMEGAFAVNGRMLDHLIGPNTEHKIHPAALAEIHRRLAKYAANGIDRHPSQVWLQTRTLRYSACHWVQMLGLREHWRDARVDAQRDANHIHLATENVTALRLTSPWADPEQFAAVLSIHVDGQNLSTPALPRRRELLLAKTDGQWRTVDAYPVDGSLHKVPGLTGPIDDVVMEPFLIVTPSGTSQHPMVERWVQFELNHFRDRWRRLFRGEVREKRDTEVTAEDARKYHLIVFGDPTSNRWLAQVADGIPIQWTNSQLEIAGRRYDPSDHMPLLIYPNPVAPNRYVAINSGMTFREGHDRTNSLQNPKLGDWAVISLAAPPDASAPGRVMEAGFFDEHWQFPAPSTR